MTDDASRPALPLAAVALLALHLALTTPMRGPMLFGDEVAYLGMARFLAGHAPDLQLASPAMKHGAFMGTGYALALTPALLWATSPGATYRAALVFNALCAAASLVVLAVFAERALGLSSRRALVAALVASLYPAYLVETCLAWSESLLVLLVPTLALAFLGLTERRTPGAAVLFGLAAGATYWVHQRTLPLLVLSLLSVLLLWRRRSLAAPAALAGILAALAVAGSARIVNGWVWARVSGRGTPLTEIQLLGNLLRPEGLWQAWLSSLGQLWYLTVASAGVALLGVWLLVQTAAGRAPHEVSSARRAAAAFALACGALLFFTSAAFMIVPDRVDKLFYGRYWEPALGLVMVSAAARLWRRPPGWRVVVAIATAPLVLGAVLLTLRGGHAFTGLFNELNVLGTAHWTRGLGGIRVLAISALGACTGLLVLGLTRRAGGAGGLGTLAAVFLGGGLYTYAVMVAPINHLAQHSLILPARLSAFSPAMAVAYDEAHLLDRGFYAYPFWIAGRRLLWFDSRVQPSPAPLVISSKAWPEAPPGARLAYPENTMDQALWILPGEVQDHLAGAGALFPSPLASAIAVEACRARIERTDPGGAAPAVASGRTVSIPIRLVHAGTGAPWPSASALGSWTGAVRIGIQWWQGGTLVSDRRAELPRSLVPGEQVGLDLPLDARTAAGWPLPPGPYEARVRVVQERIRWCDEAGSLSMPVTVRNR